MDHEELLPQILWMMTLTIVLFLQYTRLDLLYRDRVDMTMMMTRWELVANPVLRRVNVDRGWSQWKLVLSDGVVFLLNSPSCPCLFLYSFL